MTLDTMPRMSLVVPYAVQGAERPRAAILGGPQKPRAKVYMSAKHDAAEDALVMLIRSAIASHGWAKLEQPAVCLLTIVIHTARPQREMARKWGDDPYLVSSKPDTDNVAKLVMDAGKKAGVYADDTHVALLHVERWRVARGKLPHTDIIFRSSQ